MSGRVWLFGQTCHVGRGADAGFGPYQLEAD
jgi:hypothetical protein